MSIDDLKFFYREAGDWRRPTIVLLHGLPTSSHMFRDMIGRLSDRFHVLAPDYPGFGNSDAPDPDRFEYTFDHLSLADRAARRSQRRSRRGNSFLERERHLGQSVAALMDLALRQRDHATHDLLERFASDQAEAEANVQLARDRLEMVADSSAGLFMFDRDLA